LLAWAVEGAKAWLEAGLAPPAIVEKAKLEYRVSQEPLSQFYDDECVIVDGAKSGVADLYSAYCRWFDENRFRFRRLGRKAFIGEVEKRVGDRRRTRRGYEFTGVGLSAHGAEEAI